jgi:ABC-type antimicrobial peptide transport system permease subunit
VICVRHERTDLLSPTEPGRSFAPETAPQAGKTGQATGSPQRQRAANASPGRWRKSREPEYEIVGVVGNSRYNSLRNDAVPAFYQPYRPGGTVHFAIRTAKNSVGLPELLRKVVASVDPAVPLTEFHTQAALIDRHLRTERLLGFVSGAFGLIALTLAAIGLGGLLAYAVARRTSEIGVRMALGATAADVVRLVIRDSIWTVGAGVLIGLPCAYLVARVLKTVLFGLRPMDRATVTLSIVTLLLITLLAAWMPARRAAKIDPIVALRWG